jgi:glycosyltransferase involved in cell wall biosynthesis
VRIAIVHSYYAGAQASGENRAVDLQAQALRDRGHDVLVVARSTDSLNVGPMYQLRAAATVSTGRGADPSVAFKAFQPDVVHVHNLFPNWGDRWIGRRRPWPVVATLHNYRPVCSAGTLYRDGKECTLCLGGSSMHAVIHGCYRGSRMATVPLAVHTRGTGKSGQVLNKADRLIVLSPRAESTYRTFVREPERLVLLPNFTPIAPTREGVQSERDGWLFVGRLTEEKGILDLTRLWPQQARLRIIGDGPLASALQGYASPSINLVGGVNATEVSEAMTSAQGLLIPSKWAEGLPFTYIEALAHGLPIITLRGNSVGDDVAVNGAGIVLDRLDDLEQAMAVVNANWAAYSSAARNAYESSYTVKSWLSAIETVYGEVAGRHV